MTPRLFLSELALWMLVLCCSFGSDAPAQEQFLQFDKTYGGPNEESCGAMIPGSDGGYLLMGSTGPSGAEDGYLVKVDANGDPEWQFSIGGTGQDFLADAATTSAGDYLVVGQRVPTENMLLIKVASDGEVLWTKSIGTSQGSESATCILALGGDQFVVLGTRDGDLTVSWIDVDGVIQQTAAFESTHGIRGSDIVLDGDGTLLIAGGYQSVPQKAMLMKIGADGTLVWGRIYQQLENSTSHASLVPTADGGCFTCGGGGDSYATISRYNGSGDLLWRRGYTGAFTNEAAAIAALGADRFLVTMNMCSIDAGQCPSALLLVDTVGNIIDEAAFGPTSDQFFSNYSCIVLDSMGNCHLAGILRVDEAEFDIRFTRLTIGDNSIPQPCSAADVVLQEETMSSFAPGPMVTALDAPIFSTSTLSWAPIAVLGSQTICSNVGLIDEEIIPAAICYPNPVRDLLRFELPGNNRCRKAIVRDATGRWVSEGELGLLHELNVSHLVPGVYYCWVECGNDLSSTLPFVVK